MLGQASERDGLLWVGGRQRHTGDERLGFFDVNTQGVYVVVDVYDLRHLSLGARLISFGDHPKVNASACDAEDRKAGDGFQDS